MAHGTLKQHILGRWQELDTEFATWSPRLKDIAAHMLPQRARWNTYEANQGVSIQDTIINAEPRRAVRTLAAGMMSGVTSPARQWFRLATPDPDLADFGPVREYLHLVGERLRWLFQRCGFYRAASMGTYPDLAAFGFHADIVEQHPTRLMWINPLPMGEYRMACNAEGKVDTLYRELALTVRQVVQRFGTQGASARVRAAWDRGDYNVLVDVLHCIQPNADYRPGRLGPKGRAFGSYWLEKGGDDPDVFLRVSGYERFPGVCPRWETTALTDAYGRGIGDAALNDCKQLQHAEARKAELKDKVVDPPMVGDDRLRNRRMSLVSGDVTHVPQGGKFEPAITIPANALSEAREDIAVLEERIRGLFHSDLWRTLLDDDRAQRATATEIAEVKQEAMLQLGPVLENLNAEFLEPYVEHGFSILGAMGFLPDAPAELEGVDLKVEFESVMHQAQKSVALGGLRIFLGEVAGVAQAKPEVLDKVDADKVVDKLADITGIAPDLLLADEEVKKLRAARAERQAQQDAIAQAGALAQGAKNLGTTPAPSADTALGTVLQQFGPMAAGGFPQGGGVA